MQENELTRVPVRPTDVAVFSECYRPTINGVVASIDALREGLQQAGVRVTIVAPRARARSDADAALVAVPSLPLPTSTGYRLCIPFVQRRDRARVRDAQVVHVQSPFVTGWLGAFIARRHGIPLVFTYHTRIEEYVHYAPFDARVMRAAMIALTRWFANAVDTVIVPTQAMESRLRELGVRVPIAVVPSSIDVPHFASGRRTRAVRTLLGDPDAPIVLAVSRLGKEKNLELAIDALAHALDVRLAIAGDGPHRAALEARARRLGVAARIRFMGALERHVLPDVYASSDAFAFTSSSETQGLVLAEALAAGLPIVAVDGPVAREVAGPSARFVPSEPRVFARELEAAVAGPGASEAARAAAARFGPAVQAGRTLEVYRALLAG